MKGGLDTLVLRLTNRCNLACGYCYAGSGPAGEEELRAIRRIYMDMERVMEDGFQ